MWKLVEMEVHENQVFEKQKERIRKKGREMEQGKIKIGVGHRRAIRKIICLIDCNSAK